MLCVCVVLLICAAVATHVPAAHLPRIGSELILHGIGYLVLGGALWLTLRGYAAGRRRRIAWTLLAMTTYAALDEITQSVFGRSASLVDWAADVVGVLAAIAMLELLALARRKPPPGGQ